MGYTPPSQCYTERARAKWGAEIHENNKAQTDGRVGWMIIRLITYDGNIYGWARSEGQNCGTVPAIRHKWGALPQRNLFDGVQVITRHGVRMLYR